jgi:hypothetical protein
LEIKGVIDFAVSPKSMEICFLSSSETMPGSKILLFDCPFTPDKRIAVNPITKITKELKNIFMLDINRLSKTTFIRIFFIKDKQSARAKGVDCRL